MELDLVVIGTGTAAMVCAMRVAKANWKVAVVDEKPFGGTCSLRGCDPKKMLIAGAETIDAKQRMTGHGVGGDLHIDWPDLIRFKRSFTDPVPEKHERRYEEAGIVALHGTAKFTGPDQLSVGDREFRYRKVLIASGARPMPLAIPGEEHLIGNEGFLELPSLPKRIILVGGGYIAAEFSHIAARGGAEVTIIQRGPRMLTQFEPELVNWLMDAFDRIGVRVIPDTTVESIRKRDRDYVVHASGKGGPIEFAADLVVHAAGRVPAIERLDLEKAGIAAENGKLKLNEFLQSVSNPAVYAAGDAASNGPPLTPVSSHDAKVVAANIVEGNHREPDYRGVPSVAFTLPPIARVGLTEVEANNAGLKFRTKCERTSQWFTARRVAEPVYGHKTLIEEETGKILGAHLVGPGADQAVNIFGLAIRHGLTADDLKTTMFAYPTGVSDIGYMV